VRWAAVSAVSSMPLAELAVVVEGHAPFSAIVGAVPAKHRQHKGTYTDFTRVGGA
jgi:hypothetical protein